MRLLTAAVLLLVPGASAGASVGVSVQAQAAATSGQDEAAKIEKMLHLATEGKPGIRSQAADRFVRFGEPALERVKKLLGMHAAAEAGAEAARFGLAGLGTNLVEALSGFDDSELRGVLWSALADPAFPWRPAALRGLAGTALPGEQARFNAHLADPIGAVRHAALGAVDVLPSEATLDTALIRDLLADPNDRVRRRAAAILADRGDARALFTLLEDLKRDDRFFQMRTGQTARFESYRLLLPRLSEQPKVKFNPRRGPGAKENPAALEALERLLRGAAGGDVSVPVWARAGRKLPEAQLGFELRSCRAGEFFLRLAVVDGVDELWVGTGNPLRIPLERGTIARLRARAEAAFGTIDEDFRGELGCDQEVVHLRDAAGKTRSVRLSKGPRPIEGLRPAPLGGLAIELLELLPEHVAGDPRGARLRERVEQAFNVLGGPLPKRPN